MSSLFNNSTIILLIGIVLLSSIVVGTSLNTSEQANFAKFCSDYSEVQSAVSSGAVTHFGNAFVGELPSGTLAPGYSPTMAGAYNYVATGEFENPTTEKVLITNDCKLYYDMTLPTGYSGTWSIDTNNGTLYYSGFEYNDRIYTTPTEFTEK